MPDRRLFLDQTDIGYEFAHDFGRAVGRTIVHDENFYFGSWEILLHSVDDGFFDKAFVVVGVD